MRLGTPVGLARGEGARLAGLASLCTGHVLAAGCVTSGSGSDRATSSAPPPPLLAGNAVARPAVAAPAGAPLPVHGSLRTRYRLRKTSERDDHDLEGLLRLDVGDDDSGWLTGHLLLWTNLDLDEHGSGPDAFFDLGDTHERDLTARLQQAYVDARASERLELLRIGRQPLYETPEVLTFDGVRAETPERGDAGLRAGAYAGVPAHLYESSPRGDLVLGAFGEARPWRGAWARLDWMHLEDELLLEEQRDDLLAFSAWQTLGPRLRLEGAYSRLEGEGRDVRTSARWVDAERDLAVRVSYYELFHAQKDLATEVDPFFEALLELLPFRRAQVLVSKGFHEHVQVEAGTELRRLRDGSDEGRFNHDQDRHHVRVGLEDLLESGVSLGLTGEILEGRDGGAIRTFELDLAREWGPWTVSGGSHYALYDLDPLTADERDHVRAWFLGLRHEWSARLRLDLDYELERDDLDRYHLLRLGALWRF